MVAWWGMAWLVVWVVLWGFVALSTGRMAKLDLWASMAWLALCCLDLTSSTLRGLRISSPCSSLCCPVGLLGFEALVVVSGMVGRKVVLGVLAVSVLVEVGLVQVAVLDSGLACCLVGLLQLLTLRARSGW